MRNMFSKRMDSRGQISAEYLLLMVIIILILSSVTIPLASESIDASNDVSVASDAKVAVQSIADAANAIYANGPGAIRTFKINIPTNMQIVSGGKQIRATVPLSDGTNKTINASTEYTIGTQTYTLSKGWHSGYIRWSPGGGYLQLAIN